MSVRIRPVLVYDGDCRFCSSCVDFIERRIPTSAEIIPWQCSNLDALGTSAQQAEHELVWVHSSGRVDGGAQAITHLLIDAGGPWRPLGRLLRVPPVRWLAHAVYRLVADNRHRLPGGTPACALPAADRPGAAGR